MRLSAAALPLLLAGNSAIVDGPGVGGVAPAGVVDVRFTGLRSHKGMVRACLTSNPRFFPDCKDDPAALKESVPATERAQMRFAVGTGGEYALVVLHDENANNRADMFLGVPREGVGFSENPTFTFGPPKFSSARFTVAASDVEQVVRMKYFF